MIDTGISVVIPAFNAERYLAESIESVLAQTCPVREIIVVDDGSTDRTAAIAQQYSATLIQQANAGVAAAMNTGIQHASCALIAANDADDLWVEDKIEKQMAAMARDDVDVVFGHIRQFHSPEISPEQRKAVILEGAEILPGEFAQCMLARRRLFHEVGLFDETLSTGYFIEWLGRDWTGINRVMLDDILTHRRLHLDNMGIREKSSRSDFLRILRDKLERERAGKKTE